MSDGRSIECPNCHDANKYGDYEGPTCDVCLGKGFVPAEHTLPSALGKRAADFIRSIDPFGDQFSQHDLMMLAGEPTSYLAEACGEPDEH